MDKIISITLGLTVGILTSMLIRPPFVYHGPDSNVIRKQIFHYENKCYKLEPVIYLRAK